MSQQPSNIASSEKEDKPGAVMNTAHEKELPQEVLMNQVYHEEPFISEMKRKRMKENEKKKLVYSARRLKHILREKPVNKVRLVYQAYFFAVSMTVLVLSILAFRDQEVYVDRYIQIITNWEKPPIEEVKFTYTNKNCEDAYGKQFEALYEYSWPGTMIGCDCSHQADLATVNTTRERVDRFFAKYFLIGRVCSTNMRSQNCQTVNEEFSKTFKSWNDGKFGKPFVLCAKRIQNVNYINHRNYCGEKTCGSGDNRFCVPKNQTCPATEIGFSTDGNHRNILQLNDKNYGQIVDLGRSFHLYLIRNTSSHPISEVMVNEGQRVCAQNFLQNISPRRIEYPLLNIKRTQCLENDESFKILHQIDEEQYYLSNNIIYLETKLPYFNVDKNYNWSIFARPYIRWGCSDDLFHKVVDEGKTLYQVYISLKLQLAFTIAYFIVVGVIMGIIGTMTAFNFAWSCMITSPESQYNYIFLIEIGTKMVMQLVEVIIIAISFHVMNTKLIVVRETNDNACFSDEVSQKLFNDLERDLEKNVWSLNLAILVIFCVTFLVDLLLIKHSTTHGHHHGAKHHHDSHAKKLETKKTQRKSIFKQIAEA